MRNPDGSSAPLARLFGGASRLFGAAAPSGPGFSVLTEATARARMDAALKEEAEAILAECGLNPTQGINLFYRQVVLRHGLPFDVRLPNAESREAMREIETGNGLVRFGSAEDLFRDLEI